MKLLSLKITSNSVIFYAVLVSILSTFNSAIVEDMLGYFNRYLALLGCLGLICLIGCRGGDSNVGLVTGKVMVDGEPIEKALVSFSPTSGRGSMAYTDENGVYELAYTRDQMGAVIGKHKVTVETKRDGYTDYDNGGKKVKARKEILPKKYTDFKTTELKADVKQGDNKFDFDLKTK